MITAVGGESYVVIGNFSDNISTHRYFIEYAPSQEAMLESSAYYYVDEVMVMPKWHVAFIEKVERDVQTFSLGSN
ncbi:MAG: hypothetical protein ABIS36_24755 [Chryseolinea sp.]